MKKIIACLFVIFLFSLLFSACEIRAKYKFLHDSSKISFIEIVEVGDENSQGNIEQNTIYIIDDIDAFIEDFAKVDCYILYSDPAGIENNTTVIKVIYNNNDYELIGVEGQAQYLNGEYENYVGYRYFDRDQYESLILKYSFKTDVSSISPTDKAIFEKQHG